MLLIALPGFTIWFFLAAYLALLIAAIRAVFNTQQNPVVRIGLIIAVFSVPLFALIYLVSVRNRRMISARKSS